MRVLVCACGRGRCFQDITKTGLLGKADALRELGIQRLMQRLADLEGVDEWGTVGTYAILNTGLEYAK